VIVNIRTFMDGHKPPDRVLPSMLWAAGAFTWPYPPLPDLTGNPWWCAARANR